LQSGQSINFRLYGTKGNLMSKAHAIVIREFGGPDVLQIEERMLPPPDREEVRIRQTAIGFNYIDVYQRKGVYKLPLPCGIGHEAAGVVEAVGTDVRDVCVGDRVAYMNAGIGAYTDWRNVSADKLVTIPDGIADDSVVAMFFKGMTAQYLLKKTCQVQKGDLIVIHAAAGGVGQILSGWAKSLGATVVGTAGSPIKCEIARQAGCDIAIDYTQPNWPQALLDATGGRKARVVYDSVGRDTFLHSLDLAAPFGLVVLFGAASGAAPAIDPELLNKKGGLFLTRPSVFPHNADPAIFRANAADLFRAIAAGLIRPNIGARFKLAEASAAHRLAEAHTNAGAILLDP
jgi:NADPH:quinone reductase